MKDSKNIYTLLNEMEINIDDYEKEMLSDIEKQNLKSSFKKNLKKKFNFKKLGTVAAALLISIGIFSQTTIGKSVYANAESKISEISYSIGKSLGLKKNIEPYTNIVGETREDKGIEVKLNEVVIDKDELIFSTIVCMDKTVDRLDFDFDIYIDGKKTDRPGGGGDFEKIDHSENIFFNIAYTDIKEIDTTKNMDIKIVLNNLNYNIGTSMDNIVGKWVFEFNANGAELAKNTYAFPLNYSFNIGNKNYILEEFRSNLMGQKIFGKIENDSEYHYIVLEGYDDLGNKVGFFPTSESRDNDLNLTNLVFEYDDNYGVLSDEAKYITLIPYASKPVPIGGNEDDPKYDSKPVGEEFTIFLDK